MTEVREDQEAAIRPFRKAEPAMIAEFVEQIPAHDLLFLDRDLRNPRVIEAWRRASDSGEIDSLMAIADGKIVGTVAVLKDPLSWSAHVAEIRLLVLPEWRHKGLGRTLLESSMARAIEGGAAKLTARMTPDQVAAITLFEEEGFRGEAMLLDHVRDDSGQAHDLAVLSLDVVKAAAKREALEG